MGPYHRCVCDLAVTDRLLIGMPVMMMSCSRVVGATSRQSQAALVYSPWFIPLIELVQKE